MSIPPCFLIIFTKGNNSYDYMFNSLDNQALQKGVFSDMKVFAAIDAKSFLSNQKRGKYENGRVGSSRS